MAINPQDIKNLKQAQAELRKLNLEYQKLTGKSLFDDLPDKLKTARSQIEVFDKVVSSARRESAGLASVFESLNVQLKANLSEIDKANTALGRGKRAYRDLVNTVRQLADEESGIDRLSFQQLKKLKSRNASALKEVQLAGKRLNAERGITSEADVRASNLTEAEEALSRAALQNFENEKKANRFVEYRLGLERKVLDNVKLTGGALQGIGNLASSLGLSGFAESIEEIKGELDDDIRKKIREAAIQEYDAENDNKRQDAVDEITDATDNLVSLNEKLKTAKGKALRETKKLIKEEKERLKINEDIVEASEEEIQKKYETIDAVDTLGAKTKALGKAAKKFGEQLTDPLVLIGGILKGFLAVDEAATKLQRTTGQNTIQLAGNNDALVTSAEVMEMMSGFAELTGRNLADLVSDAELGRLRILSDQLGLSAEEAANLAMNTNLSGTSANEFADSAFNAAKELAVADKSGVNLGQVLQETTKASGALALNLGNNPKALGRATYEAQRLGLNLQQLEGIAEGMLDFESSIQNELEAQLLTGKNINLAKAREFALRGDLENLAKEITKQEGVMEAFSSKNLIAQQAAAKAVGMSRNELAKVIALKAIEDGLGEDAASRMADMEIGQVRQLSTQDKFNKAIGKLQQSLAPLIEALVPLVDLLAAGAQQISNMFSVTMDNRFIRAFVKMNDKTSELNDGIGKMSEGMNEFSGLTKLVGTTVIGGILIGGLKRLLKLIKPLKDGFLDLIGLSKKATPPGGSGGSGGLGGLFKKGGLKKLGKGFLRKAGPIAAVMAAFDAVQGFQADAEATIAQKLLNAGESALSGLSFGIVGRSADEIEADAKKEINNQPKTLNLDDFTIRSNPADTLVMAGGTKFGDETNALLKQLIDEVANIKGDVYIDGYRAGQSIFAASNNLPS